MSPRGILTTSVLFIGLSLGSSIAQQPLLDKFEVAKRLQEQGFTTFAMAVDATDVLSQIDDEGSVFLIPPTDNAWAALPLTATQSLFDPENREYLAKIVGCHIIDDPQWGNAITAIRTAESGRYTTETVGGCLVTSEWINDRIMITDYYGSSADLVDAPTTYPGLEGINGVFIPPGTEVGTLVRSSRLFAGPSHFPPTDFAAYGVLAFKSRATDADRQRHSMFCDAYVQALPHSTELNRNGTPVSEQMATVWPISTDGDAIAINRSARSLVCAKAIDSYGLVAAQTAIKEAAFAGANVSGDGPFLIAWAPPSQKGMRDAIVLFYDMSAVRTPAQAAQALQVWRDAIEGDQSLWENGFSLEYLRLTLRNIVDDISVAILRILPGD